MEQNAFEGNNFEKIILEGDPFRFNDEWESIGFPTLLKIEYLSREKIYIEYENAGAKLSEEHPFIGVNFLQVEGQYSINQLINSGKLIILFIGSSKCPACVQTIGTVSDYFYSEGIDNFTSNIFYYEDFVGDPASVDRISFLEAYPGITRTTPQIIAFFYGEIIARYQAPSEGVTIERQVKTFFTNVLDQVE